MNPFHFSTAPLSLGEALGKHPVAAHCCGLGVTGQSGQVSSVGFSGNDADHSAFVCAVSCQRLPC